MYVVNRDTRQLQPDWNCEVLFFSIYILFFQLSGFTAEMIHVYGKPHYFASSINSGGEKKLNIWNKHREQENVKEKCIGNKQRCW